MLHCQECELLFTHAPPDDLPSINGAEYFDFDQDKARSKDRGLGTNGASPDGEAAFGYTNYSQISPIQFRWQLALLRLFEGPRAHRGARLLDLGCANGRFLEMASGAGFLSTGLDMNSAAAATARAHGLSVIESSFDRVPSSELGQFDVITAWDLIEHVPDLRGTLHKIHSILAEGGCFIFSTPDAGAPRVREQGNRWINFTSFLRHFTYLTQPFLARALRETFGSDPALISFEVGADRTSLVGIVRKGGLRAGDRHIAEMLARRDIPSDEAELRSIGAELGWFYLTFEQLEAVERLLAASEGVLPADLVTALEGGVLYKAGQFGAALPLLKSTAAQEPLLLSWLAESQEVDTLQRLQEMQAKVDAKAQELIMQRGQMQKLERQREKAFDELSHYRNTIEQIKNSATWKLGRGITGTIELVPFSQVAFSGFKVLRTHGFKAALETTQQYVAQRLAPRLSLPSQETPSDEEIDRPTPTRKLVSKLQEGRTALSSLSQRGWARLDLYRRRVRNGRIAALSAQPQLERTSVPVSASRPVTVSAPRGAAARGLKWAEMGHDPALGRHRCLPLISVILPVYNQSDLLRSSVESVLAQSYPNLELIVLDDGSREDILGALHGFLELPSVRLFRQPNQKLPRALTHAFQLARGELLTWTSADNLMEPHALAQLADALFGHPEAVLAYADVRVIDDRGQPLRDGSYRPLNVDANSPDVIRLFRSDKALAAERDNFINACFLYRRNAAEALGHRYADELRGAEDYDFWLRLQRCGRLLHIGNAEPLYAYRVHQRSMSHELVTQELTAHGARCEQLLLLERQRQDYAKERWTVQLSSTLPPAEQAGLRALLAQLPVTTQSTGSRDTAAGSDASKLLRFLPENGPSTARLYVRVLADRYQLVCRPPGSLHERVIDLPRGSAIDPLATKARDARPDRAHLPPLARSRPVFGCHLPPRSLGLECDRLRRIIRDNPWAYFMFLGDIRQDANVDGAELCRDLDNAGYFGTYPIGSPYHLYAYFDWLLLPPFTDHLSEAAYREHLALAYAIGRPLVLCGAQPTIPAPFQLRFASPDDTSLNFCKDLRRDELDTEILDAYLEAWTPLSSLTALLRLADAASQDWAVPMPDFASLGIQSAPLPAPSPPEPVKAISVGSSTQGRPLKVALLVDTLDVGGMEEVVAFLANNFAPFGIDPKVVCFQRGGHVAERLRQQGHTLHVADGDLARLIHALRSLNVDLINTHYASLPAVEISALIGRPIVETIHNTYVWLSPEQWEAERRRSRHFAATLAVSSLVKQYYMAHNPEFTAERITVAGNAIDPTRIVPVPRLEARRALSVDDDALLFLSVGRYGAQKNQLGLLHAFVQVAERYPHAQLMFVGNFLKEDHAYVEALKKARAALPCAKQVRIEPFRSDVSTLLSAADVMVMDSYFEGWSLAATEALIVGTPLIHSLCGSAEELCGPNGERGLIVPNPGGDLIRLDGTKLIKSSMQPKQENQGALIAAMERFIVQHAQWKARRDAISAYALRVFHPTAVLSRYARVFRSVTRTA